MTIRLINLNEAPYFSGDSTDQTWTRLGPQTKDDYPENSTATVSNYQAVDPDKANNILWYVYGTDAADFTIVGGQLRFRKSPNYEEPSDRGLDVDNNGSFTDGGDFEPTDNGYQVTVRATERTAEGGGPLKSVDVDLTVTVTNEDEMGTVDLNLLQPEVGTEITGRVIDLDGAVSGDTNTWWRSKVTGPNLNPDPANLDAEWARATGSGNNSGAYTPNESDEGKHLLMRSEYSNPENLGPASAIGISVLPVRADVLDPDNASPDFESNSTTRSIPENTSVGSPVGQPVIVDINEDNDVLTYELVMEISENLAVVEGDLPFFSIDKASGQITLDMELSAEAGAPDEQSIDGRTYTTTDGVTTPTPGMYTVVVRATDPSGEDSDENRTTSRW